MNQKNALSPRNSIRALLTTLSLLSLSLLAPAAVLADTIKDAGCSFNVPAGWKVASGASRGQDYMAFGPIVGNIIPNLGIHARPPQNNVAPADLEKTVLANIDIAAPGFRLIAQKTAVVSGRPAVETIGTVPAPKLGVPLRADQYVITTSAHTYVLTMVAPENQAAKYEDIFAKVVRSIKITR